MRQGYSKYGNQPVVIDGHRFDSKSEARRYNTLCLLLRGGVIRELEVHPRFKLHAGVVYEADFAYVENDHKVVEDVKGKETDVFRIKAKLFRWDYPDIDFRVIPAKEA